MTASRESWSPFLQLRGKRVGLCEPVIGPKNRLVTAVAVTISGEYGMD